MMKWLVLAAVLVAVFWWIGRGRTGGARPPRSDPAQPGAADPPGRTRDPQSMVECAHCGLLLPEAEALPAQDGKLHYCSEQHLAIGPRARR